VEAGQFDGLFPHVQVGLVKLHAGEADFDAFAGSQHFPFEVFALLALDGGEQRASEETVGCASGRLCPSR